MKSIYDIEVCSNDESTSAFPLKVSDAPVDKTFVYLAWKIRKKPSKSLVETCVFLIWIPEHRNGSPHAVQNPF